MVLIDMLMGTLALVAILLAVITALMAQNQEATRLARHTRVRMLLEGEIEWMRGLPPAQVRPCESQPFEPALGVPLAVQQTRFHRTVTLDESGRLAGVLLTARLPDARGDEPSVVLEGVVYLTEDRPR